MSDSHVIFTYPIWGYVLGSEQFHTEDYIEYILHLKDTQKSIKKSNILGWQSEDTIYTHGIFRELCVSIENISAKILRDYGISRKNINAMWANVNHKYCSNMTHAHSGILSGVFYVSAPNNCGELVFIDPATRNYAHPIKNNNYSVKPEKLGLIIFPSWMEHYVGPNLSDEDRISISFNIE
jgi:uncharacterized protein (TIGR02466 family)